MSRAALAAAEVRAAPSEDAEQVASLITGERFAVLEFAGGWAWGFVEDSHLVGYVPAETLGDIIQP